MVFSLILTCCVILQASLVLNAQESQSNVITSVLREGRHQVARWFCVRSVSTNGQGCNLNAHLALVLF
jgi:hypothetical protein